MCSVVYSEGVWRQALNGAWWLPICWAALVGVCGSIGWGQLVMDVGQSGEVFTVLGEREGLNLSDSIFVDLSADGMDDLVVAGDATDGGDRVATFFLLMADRVRPGNGPYNLREREADARWESPRAGWFDDSIRMVKGDWDGDGREDLAISGRSPGAVYIIQGREDFATGTNRVLGPDTVDIYLPGEVASGLGRDMVTADINGDECDDLVLRHDDGVHVLFGGVHFTDRHLELVNQESADFSFEDWGSTLGAGDVNGDGRDDLFAGGGTTSHLYLSKPSYTAHEVINAESPEERVAALNFGKGISRTVSIGMDLNGDGLGDWTILSGGEFKAVWGRSTWPVGGVIDLTLRYDLHVSYGFNLFSVRAATSDINLDGIPDLVVTNDGTPQLHGIFGRDFESGTTLDLPGYDLSVRGLGGDDRARVALGNVDESGIPQLSRGTGGSQPWMAGAVYVCFPRPDIHEIRFSDDMPRPGEALTVSHKSGWMNGQEVAYRWYVDGDEVSAVEGATLPGSAIAEGSQVRVELTARLPTLGMAGEVVRSAELPPVIPRIEHHPESFSLSRDELKALPEQVLRIWNGGGGVLSYAISKNVDWISTIPTSGSSVGEFDSIALRYDAEATGDGIHRAIITVNDPNAERGAVRIPVVLVLGENKLMAGDSQLGDGLGVSVGVSGMTAVVGAPGDSDEGDLTGSAYIFENSEGVWFQRQKLTVDDAVEGDRFGAIVAVWGDTVVIGTQSNSLTSSSPVYVFERQGGEWSQVQKIFPEDLVENDRFGRSLAIWNDTILIGASQGGEDFSGAVYVYRRVGGVWTRMQKLEAEDARPGNKFGSSVAISEGTIVIGAEGDQIVSRANGGAYIFMEDDGKWVQRQKLNAYDPGREDRFGSAVAVSGEFAIVAADGKDDWGQDSGAVYLFVREEDTWRFHQKLEGAGVSAGDSFGTLVAISGYQAVVSAPDEDGGTFGEGAVYVFTRDGDRWKQVAKKTAADASAADGFGDALSLDGDLMVVGVPGDDDGGGAAGAAFYFDVSTQTGTQSAWPQYR